MEIIIKACFINSIDDIDTFQAKVSEKNYKLARYSLEYQKAQIIDYFKQLKKEGKIKSIFRPKNRNDHDTFKNN